MSDDILYERHGHVRLITINRPARMNSMDFAANDAIIERWKEFDADDDARVAVITGAGDRAFCAGADLKTYTMAYATTPVPEFRRRFTNGPGFGGITRNLPVFKPIVAAVNGYAVSGGLELALAADIRFCSPGARFGLQDTRWGFHPCDGALVRLKEIVGLGNAMEMILSGDLFDAEHAYRIGLVNRVVDADRLLAESLDYAARLASRAPLPPAHGEGGHAPHPRHEPRRGASPRVRLVPRPRRHPRPRRGHARLPRGPERGLRGPLTRGPEPRHGTLAISNARPPQAAALLRTGTTGSALNAADLLAKKVRTDPLRIQPTPPEGPHGAGATESAVPNTDAHPARLDDDEPADQIIAPGIHKLGHDLTDSRPRTGRVAQQDDSYRLQSTSMDQLAKILVLGQENASLPEGEPDDRLVIGSRGQVGNGQNFVSDPGQCTDDGVIAALVGKEPHQRPPTRGATPARRSRIPRAQSCPPRRQGRRGRPAP